MTTILKVHPSFFKEFATKTWISPTEIVKELVENAFDEDATKVLITIINENSIAIEDDTGMDEDAINKFLLLGSPHKKIESISPKLKRLRTGRYGTGRLSFLTSFEKMKIRTKRENFNRSFLIDSKSLDNLSTGNSELKELNESSLQRDGTELLMDGARVHIDELRLLKEIKKLAILRQPLFEVFIKKTNRFEEWNFESAQIIKIPDIQGHRIPVNLDDGEIIGEIIISRRPLSDDEKGIAIMIGNHIVTRTSFGYDSKFNKVTGAIRCDSLTSRFADKSAIIEDDKYERFNHMVKNFINETIIPSLSEYEDVLITREESKIYKELDKVLGQAVIETLESHEEIEGYELIESQKLERKSDNRSTVSIEDNTSPRQVIEIEREYSEIQKNQMKKISEDQDLQKYGNVFSNSNNTEISEFQESNVNIQTNNLPMGRNSDSFSLTGTTKIKKPILKKTFALKKIGYKVIPYEDDSDSRYSFINENVVFVNKANPTYKAESSRGDEFLLRHIMNIVAQGIAETKHPEGKEALELQNRLISEAIRIHDGFISKSII